MTIEMLFDTIGYGTPIRIMEIKNGKELYKGSFSYDIKIDKNMTVWNITIESGVLVIDVQ